MKLTWMTKTADLNSHNIRDKFEMAFPEALLLDEYNESGLDPKAKAKKEAKKYLKSYRKIDEANKELYDQLIKDLEKEIDSDELVWDENYRHTLRAYLKYKATYQPIYRVIFSDELNAEKTERETNKQKWLDFKDLTLEDLPKTIFADALEENYSELRLQTIEALFLNLSLEEILKKPIVNSSEFDAYIEQRILTLIEEKQWKLDELISLKSDLKHESPIDWVLNQINNTVSSWSYAEIVEKQKEIRDVEIAAIFAKHEQEKYRKYHPENFETKDKAYDLEALSTKTDLTYDEFKFAYFAEEDLTKRNTLLKTAIKAAKTRAKQLRATQDSDPVKSIYDKYSSYVSLKGTLGSVYVPASDEQIEIVYTSIAEGNINPPWIILALWLKEGSGYKQNDRFGVAGTSAAGMKANARSIVYYQNLGIDHFVNYVTTETDNIIYTNDEADGLAHEDAFKKRVKEQQQAGYLPKGRDFAAEINREMTANTASKTVTFTNRFYALSFMLAGSYYQDVKESFYKEVNEKGLMKGKVPESLLEAIEEATIKGDTENLKRYEAQKEKYEKEFDLAWEYVYWNGGAGVFREVFASAQKHVKNQATINKYGEITPTQFAFETKPKDNEFGQTRENAIRFKYYVEIYQLLFNGW